MVDNAIQKIAAIDQRTQELQGLHENKDSQITEILDSIAQTEQDYELADRTRGEFGQRVTREYVKLDVCKGTSAEAERSAILESVTKASDEAQEALGNAVIARDEARARQGLALALKEEIEEHQREITDLAVLRREYEAVLAEVHAQKGRELAQSIAENIIATRDAYEACEQELKDYRAAHEAATRQIDSLRDEYPELATELGASHGHFNIHQAKKGRGKKQQRKTRFR
jgi:hypothetical protein